ncbi:hypothetical protein AHMF7605_12165 [Adhaeribacter arboris]|uniref:Porin n=1 Tax=Adhaeribacter arboris TaxID=2072846 RepID=A0A2T2YFF7_9BACT|nr:hypothetical protein [Adhaeribacter arboris]PSR54223.1 hypothetical protein AHMF7605_12165 [Adhaeribacter arboris]
MKKLLFSLFGAAISMGTLQAQTDSTQQAPAPETITPVKNAATEDKPIKFNLNENGTHYFQATFLNQIWFRYNESNPGTTVVGEPAAHTFDIGLRRTRIQLFGQISDRAFLYFQFGQNNFNFNSQIAGNRKIAAFFHDAMGEYRITKGNQLKLGGGLTIANGLSRFSQPSIGTLLALDAPVFAQATVDQTDEFSRKLSVFARGQIGKFDYRAVISDPFPINTNGSTPVASTNATFSGRDHHKQYQGYLAYNFWEMEGHNTPYMTGSYLGKKKVLNVAAGIMSQKNALWTKEANGSTKLHNMLLWSTEAFIDTPLNTEAGTALTAYLGYYNYDFGPNYIRTVAQMNPADAASIDPNVSSVSGGGNGFPMMGTGNIIYGQLGYLMNKNLLGQGHGQLQPYATFYRANFNLLNDPVNVYDIGINYLISSHKVKLSFDYQNRPYFNLNNQVNGRRGSYIGQLQLFI